MKFQPSISNVTQYVIAVKCFINGVKISVRNDEETRRTFPKIRD